MRHTDQWRFGVFWNGTGGDSSSDGSASSDGNTGGYGFGGSVSVSSHGDTASGFGGIGSDAVAGGTAGSPAGPAQGPGSAAGTQGSPGGGGGGGTGGYGFGGGGTAGGTAGGGSTGGSAGGVGGGGHGGGSTGASPTAAEHADALNKLWAALHSSQQFNPLTRFGLNQAGQIGTGGVPGATTAQAPIHTLSPQLVEQLNQEISLLTNPYADPTIAAGGPGTGAEGPFGMPGRFGVATGQPSPSPHTVTVHPRGQPGQPGQPASPSVNQNPAAITALENQFGQPGGNVFGGSGGNIFAPGGGATQPGLPTPERRQPMPQLLQDVLGHSLSNPTTLAQLAQLAFGNYMQGAG